MDYIKQRTVRKHCKIKQVYAMLGYDFLFENCTYSDINSTHVLKKTGQYLKAIWNIG